MSTSNNTTGNPCSSRWSGPEQAATAAQAHSVLPIRSRHVANGDRQRAEQGLGEALDRFEARASDSSLGDPLVPFAEALNWAYSLEEWHEAELRKAGVDYYAKRDNDPDGEVVAGVIYARGLVTHRLVKVGLVASLDRYYNEYGAYGNLVWRPFTELPPPDKPEKKGRDDKYKRRVQHKRLSMTMRAVERFLTSTVRSYYPDLAAAPCVQASQGCRGILAGLILQPHLL